MNKTYKVVDGTSYHNETPDAVIEVLERARRNRTRILLDYGFTDPKDLKPDQSLGQSWGDVNDISGYVGRSGGINKIPLIIHNSRSIGGYGILDHCIVKISESKGGRVLYQHPNYKPYVD